MNLKFVAKSTTYNEAIGGDIVQVVFDEEPEDDSLSPKFKSFCFSINYEFPPCRLSFEWADGDDFGGSENVKGYSISETQFSVEFEDGTTVVVEHSADVKTFRKVCNLLRRELGAPNNV